MEKFEAILENRKVFNSTRKQFIVLDDYKSHVALDVIVKVKHHEIDLLILPSHTSHELQPLDMAFLGHLNKLLKHTKMFR